MRLPVAMIEGQVAQNVALVPPQVVVWYEDGTYTAHDLAVPDDIELTLASLEAELSIHINSLAPAAHSTGSGVVTPGVAVNWYANPGNVLMLSNTASQVISNPFEIVLEISNSTQDVLNDIQVGLVAPNGMIFLDSTRSSNMLAPSTIQGTHNSSGIMLSGWRLGPGESGYWKMQVQQSSPSPLVQAGSFGAPLYELSWKANSNSTRTTLTGLPLTAGFTLNP